MNVNKMRKTKLVTVCSVDTPSYDDGSTAYSTNTIRSRSSKAYLYSKVPINNFNIALYEVYGESYSRESSPCQRVNFLTLCCTADVDVNTIRLSFDEYQHVKYIEYTGHIGSMKVAFELLHKFPNVKELLFILNDNNIKCENEEEYHSYKYEEAFVSKALTIEKLSIVQEFSVLEKRSIDLQQEPGKIWRLDEILFLSQLCIPNIKKFETLLIGNGANYEKVKRFVDSMPYLKKNHSPEISSDKLRIRLTVNPSISSRANLYLQPRLPAPTTRQSLAVCNTNATMSSNALVPMQIIVKQEKKDGEAPSYQSANEHSSDLYDRRCSNHITQKDAAARTFPQSLVPYNEEMTGHNKRANNHTYTPPPPYTSPSPIAKNVSRADLPTGFSLYQSYLPHEISNGMQKNQPLGKSHELGDPRKDEASSKRISFNLNLDGDLRFAAAAAARNPSPPPTQCVQPSVPPATQYLANFLENQRLALASPANIAATQRVAPPANLATTQRIAPPAPTLTRQTNHMTDIKILECGRFLQSKVLINANQGIWTINLKTLIVHTANIQEIHGLGHQRKEKNVHGKGEVQAVHQAIAHDPHHLVATAVTSLTKTLAINLAHVVIISRTIVSLAVI
ncbi:hypothetical protein Ocin01_17017 [Orchesella cincta]|uniref:Uncharacterized protein n=1 Tax=Orchesella cincta TaxID=48709 RepID=A0A1D2M9K9_ORCCI|nr:hypothetical protein Ocin01_17017 [Orchesella cincta]